MTKHIISTTVIAAMLAGFIPASAVAGEPQQTSLRAAIDRAATKASIQKVTPAPGQGSSTGTRLQGRGGHATMIVLSLVGAAAGIGATYYMVKQMQKTTSQLQATQGK